MDFTKMQSAGNDYVLIEAGTMDRNWSTLARTLCDRHYGVGADSLLLLLPSTKANFMMRVFDADGSEAEACGNGIRCLAKYIYEKKLTDSRADHLKIETIAGVRVLKLGKTAGKLSLIQANMGRPQFRAEEIPVIVSQEKAQAIAGNDMLKYLVRVNGQEMALHLISMGNPHAVLFWPRPVTDFPLAELGPKVEHLDIFPNRVNFEVARVVSRQQIEARVWERGVGETLACGTGACAITVAAKLLGYTDSKVDIKLVGGVLGVEWNGTGEVLLSGPAEIVFHGEWPD